MSFWSKSKQEKITLSDIMRGMQHSVNTAQEILERHHIRILDKYFDSDGSPKMKTIKINNEQSIHIPLFSIINQSSLAIEELELEFTASVNNVDLKSLKRENTDIMMGSGRDPEKIDRTSFSMDFQSTGKKENQISVRIKFKTTTQPEGVSRIINEFDKHIQPINN